MMHHSFSRRAVLGAALAAPAAGWLAGCGDGGEPDPGTPPDEVTYLSNFGTLGRDSYAWLGLDTGAYAQANLDVTIEPGAGTNPNLQALLAGQAQFAAVDMAGATIARVEQAGFVAMAVVQRRTIATVMAYEESGIREPYDLAGRTVGLPVGAATALLFPAFVERSALIDLSEIDVQELAPPELVPALVAGRVDAIGQFDPGLPLVRGAGDGREVVVLRYDEALPDLFGVALFTTVDLATTNRDLCARFRDSFLSSLQGAIDDPQAAAQALVDRYPDVDIEVAAEEMTRMGPYCRPDPGEQLGSIDEVRVIQHIATMHGAGLLGPSADLTTTDLVDFSLVPTANGGGR